MNHLSRYLSLPLLLAVAVSTLLCSCASAKKQHPLGYIKKANDYHLKPGMRVETEDPMTRFEYKHRVHGAIESEEYVDKFGHYITVFWQGVEKGSDVSLRFEYRQTTTGAKLNVQEVTPPKVGWRNTTNFRVTGAEYAEGGVLTGWRVLLMVDGEVADEFHSFLWK